MSEMQEILRAISELRTELKSDIAKVDAKIDETRTGLRSDIAKVDAKIDETRIGLKSDIARLDTKIDLAIENVDKLAVEQQRDVVAMLQVLSTRTERIETKIDILNHRSFEQEADIQLLKKAK